jgi:hypothetical protein
MIQTEAEYKHEIDILREENAIMNADLKVTKDVIFNILKIIGMVNDAGELEEKFKIKKAISLLGDLSFKAMTESGRNEIAKEFEFVNEIKPLLEKYKNL